MLEASNQIWPMNIYPPDPNGKHHNNNNDAYYLQQARATLEEQIKATTTTIQQYNNDDEDRGHQGVASRHAQAGRTRPGADAAPADLVDT